MAHFMVHFDDSGTHPGSHIAVAACFVSTIEQWKAFEADWKKTEMEEGFNVFHMAEFAAGVAQFEGWSDGKRRRVLRRLWQIIDAHVYAGFSVGVQKPDYDQVITNGFRKYCGKYHYTFVVRLCCNYLRRYRRIYFPDSSFQYVFDWMGKGKGEIQGVLDAARLASAREVALLGVDVFQGHSFQKRSVVVPLQSADILAWACYQEIQRLTTGRRLDWIAEETIQLIGEIKQYTYMRTSIFERDGLIRWREHEEKEVKARGITLP